MADEGWYRSRRIQTTDTNGRPISLFVGQVEYKGRLETAIRVDSGPIALAPVEEVVGEYLKAIREVAEDTYIRNQRSQS